MTPRYNPAELADALGLPAPTDEQAAVIAAPPGPLVVIAGAGAGKTETMAARVVWLVANGYAHPGQVLGLTFTRKAAAQLLRRVRSRLSRLAGAGLRRTPADAEPATVSTYHAFAGALLRDHGLLLAGGARHPVAQRNRVVAVGFSGRQRLPGRPRHRQEPRPPSRRWCCGCRRRWPSTSSTPPSCATPTSSSSGWCTPCPRAPYQRDRGPSQWLLRMLAVQHERTQLVPLVDALHARMRAEKVMDFGQQMAAAARLAAGTSRGGRAVAAPLPRRAARRVPRHRSCPAHRVVVAVRRRSRRRAGIDCRRRPDPVHLRLARRVGHQPAAVRHRLPARRRHARRRRWNCAPAGEIRRGPCTWPTRCRPRPVVARWRCAHCGRGRMRRPALFGARFSTT